MGYLVEHYVHVGDEVVDAIGVAEERREELELAKEEREGNATSSRRKTKAVNGEIGVTSKGRTARNMTKLQASMMLGLWKEMLLMMKCLLASVATLCAICVVLILKK